MQIDEGKDVVRLDGGVDKGEGNSIQCFEVKGKAEQSISLPSVLSPFLRHVQPHTHTHTHMLSPSLH